MVLTLLLKRLNKNKDLQIPNFCLKTITAYIEKSISVI